MGLLDSVFGGTDTSALRAGAGQANKLLKKGEKKGLQELSIGESKYTPQYDAAAGAFAPYQRNGETLNNLYTDALSGTPEGYARATDAFHTSPGYAFQRDEALQGVERLFGDK